MKFSSETFQLWMTEGVAISVIISLTIIIGFTILSIPSCKQRLINTLLQIFR